MQPWEFTANHYLAIPWIDPSDGAIHGMNVLHRGTSALVSWAGSRTPVPGGSPLLRLTLWREGRELAAGHAEWERLDRWIPRYRIRAGDVALTVTICTPGGFAPLAPGGFILVRVESAEGPVEVRLVGRWAWTLRTAASTGPALAANRIRQPSDDSLVLEAGEMPSGAALAILAAGAGGQAILAQGHLGSVETGGEIGEVDQPNGRPIEFGLGCRVENGHGVASFVFGVAPEGDGAVSAARRLAEVGAEELLRRARLDLASLNRATDEVAARDVAARNLVFHHYSAAARAIDDDRLYPVMSRSPDHGACAVFGETEALFWSLPAYALTDPLIARELLLRILEVYSDRPGNLRRYIEGGILDSGYSLARSLQYGLAIEGYVDITRDEQFAGEPLPQQVLREIDEAVWGRLHPEVFLAATNITAGGEAADFPYSAWDNALLWRFSRVIDRLVEPDEGRPKPRFARSDAELEAAFWQRFPTDVDGLTVIGYTTDLDGRTAVYDDPCGSLRLLPYLGFCGTDDPIWSNTMELLHSTAYPLHLGGSSPGFAGRSRPAEASFAVLCSDLLCPWRSRAVEILRGLDLPGGVACGTWDPVTGRAVSQPWAAAEAGFLVWALLTGGPVPVADAGSTVKTGKRGGR